MSREIQIIEPINRGKYLPGGIVSNAYQKRVAAYCRVSSEKDQQLNSFDNQVDEWTKRLQSDPSVIFVGIYADEGISGTSDERRKEFQRMIADAKAGKIDKIVTKSISRFARNVADSINIARDLKEIGVEIYFDNEHISTLDPSSEVMFTLNAVMAQEESRHISENVKWTFSKNFREGIPMIPGNLLGYRRDPNNPKNLIIIPEEAEIVKLVFELYTNNVGPGDIARLLEQKGYKTSRGKTKWYYSTIEGIITNEKYCGDLLLQKSVTTDFLKHKRVKNDGLAHQYFIQDNHEPIVDRETWDKAQVILAKNSMKFRGTNKDCRKYTSRYPFSGLLICNECGDTYKRRQWTQGYKTPRIVFQCNHYISGYKSTRCKNKPISEDIVAKTVCEVINKIYLQDNSTFSKMFEIIKKHIHLIDVDAERDELKKQQRIIDSEIDDIIQKKSRATSDVEQDMLDRKYRERIADYNDIEQKILDLDDKEKESDFAKLRMEEIREILKNKEFAPEMLSKEIIEAFIQNIIVINRNDIVIVLATAKASYHDIRDKRAELIAQEPILQGDVNLPRHFRPEHLHYRVVIY